MRGPIPAVAAAALVLGTLAVAAAAADGATEIGRKALHRHADARASGALAIGAGRFRLACDRNGRHCAWVDAGRPGLPGSGYAPHGWFGYDPTAAPLEWAFPCGQGYFCAFHRGFGTHREPLPLIR